MTLVVVLSIITLIPMPVEGLQILGYILNRALNFVNMFQFAIFQFLNWVKLVCNLNRLLQFCCSLATLSTVFVEMIHFLASTTKVLGLWALPFDKLITPVWQLCNNFASKNFVPSYFLSYPSLLLLYPHVPGPVNQTSSIEKCASKWITFSAILMIQLQHMKKNLILG
jgi:hypothetical protein